MTLPTILTLLALGVLAVTLVAVGLPLIARLRAQETLGGASASDANLTAINELGQRIETLVNQQQEQGETQRQRLAQQIDTVQQTVGEQRVLVDGLRSEMRHELQRRDHEMEEIRSQIATIQQTLPALAESTMPALPPASDGSTPMDEEDFVPMDDLESSMAPDTDDAFPLEAAPQEDFFSEVVDPFALEPIDPPNELATPDPDTSLEEEASIEVETGTPDWSEADLPDPMFEDTAFEDTAFEDTAFETAAFETAAFETTAEISTEAPEPADDSAIAVEATHLDVFADVSTFDVVEPSSDSAPEEPLDTFSLETPEATREDTTSRDVPDERATVADSDAPADAPVFEELAVAEMSFVDPTPDPYAFDPNEAASEIDAIEASLADLLPAAPAAEEPAASVFTDAEVPTEVLRSETEVTPDSTPELQADAPAENDTFAPTPFLEDVVPTADPLAFEETFVPTSVESPDVDSEDVFASWSPTSFEEADLASPTLSFTEPTTVGAPATPTEAAPVDLSSFEDWGLDPEPVATPQPLTWAPADSAETTFDAWAPAPQATPPSAPTPPTPAPPPQPIAPPQVTISPAVEPPADPESPTATAWVVRNEALQPSPPPAAKSPTDEAPAYDEPTFEETPSIAASQSAPDPAPSLATISVVPTAPAASPAPEAESASEPQPLPEGVERLTVLPSIDDDLERALHLAGVTTLDEMARWGRTDARRIAGQVGVSEETVLNHWVFEAQTALFERFTQQVGS